MGRAAALRFFVPFAALAVASGADLFGRVSLERAVDRADARGADAALPYLPFDAFARETAAALAPEDAAGRARARALVGEGLSRRPMGAELLRHAALLEDDAGREAKGSMLLLEAVHAARDQTGFAVLAANDRIGLARRHAAAASLAFARAERLDASGGADAATGAAEERRLAAEEVALARAALEVVPSLRAALASDAIGYSDMDARVDEARRLARDLDEIAGPK